MWEKYGLTFWKLKKAIFGPEKGNLLSPDKDILGHTMNPEVEKKLGEYRNTGISASLYQIKCHYNC